MAADNSKEKFPALVEDCDGAPYPICGRCSDQIAPPKDHGRLLDWMHVYESQNGYRGYLHNCSRPHDGQFGTIQNRATYDPQ